MHDAPDPPDDFDAAAYARAHDPYADLRDATPVDDYPPDDPHADISDTDVDQSNADVAARRQVRMVEAELRRLRARRDAMMRLDEETWTPPSSEPITLRHSIDNPRDTGRERIRGLLIEHGRLTIVAQRKAGKTTMVGNIVHALLTGDAFLDHYDVEPVTGTVFVLSYEMNETQLAAWLVDQGLTAYAERIVVWHLRGEPNPLRTRSGRDQLAQYLDRLNVTTVLVDTFSRAFVGESQQDNTAVSAWLLQLDEVVGPNRELVLTVHAGWTAERSRGASALEDWPDTIVTIAVDDDTRYMTTMGRDVDDVDGKPLIYDTSTRLLRLDYFAPSRGAAKAAKRAAEKLQDERRRDNADRQRRTDNLQTLLRMIDTWDGDPPGVNQLRRAAPDAGWRGQNAEVNEALAHAVSWRLVDVHIGQRNKRGHAVTDAGRRLLAGSERFPTYGDDEPTDTTTDSDRFHNE